ncbi:MAG: HTH domain-containing protein [Bacteroidaceae bacterium]|nr:HTH domain-containing protein [Bacteroidaceae bacterium]
MENNERLWYDSSEIDIIRCYESKVSEYGQISLAMDYDTSIKGCMSDMMWGHYGENGKGVCIEIVTFPNVPEKVPENVTDFMKETTETLSKKLSVSVRTIKRNLKRMQELGVVTREGADHGGRWIVLSNHESVE